MLPSTSPANAAVPWSERLEWFFELAGRVRGMPQRSGVRALVLDATDRVLLVRFEDAMGSWWATPGGGVDAGESDAAALRRELGEEVGLHEFELGPLLWTREHWRVDPPALRRSARAVLSRANRRVRHRSDVHHG